MDALFELKGKETAGEAMANVRAVERARALGLTGSAMITKDSSGQVHVKNEWSSGTEAGAAVGARAGAYIGSKLDPGVDGKFVDDVVAGLQPGNSALFLMLKDESDPAALVAAFCPFKEAVYKATLSTDLEDSQRRSLSRKA